MENKEISTIVDKTKRETPEWLANKMVDILLRESGEIEYYQQVVLEPSCGRGNIIEAIESYCNCPIVGVELNKELSKDATERFNDNLKIKIINGDFLNIGKDLIQNNKIRHIVMLPPFKNMIFIEHIHLILDAWKTFKDNRILISLVHNGFWTDNSEASVKLRKTINEYETRFIPIPDNTFMEKGKSVPCSIMVLNIEK